MNARFFITFLSSLDDLRFEDGIVPTLDRESDGSFSSEILAHM